MLSPADSTLLQAGLVDLDGTFLFQLGVFLLFFVALNFLVVKPMIKAHEQRYKRMEGARQDAEAMDLRAGEAATDYEAKIGEARRAAVSARDGIAQEAEGERRKTVATAREAARASEQKAADARDALRKKADFDMRSKVDELSDAIVERLIGKAGG